MHEPVMVAEVLEHLAPARGGVFVDCTVGYGGHTRAMLHAGASRVIGLDRDPDALRQAGAALASEESRVELVHSDYRRLDEILDARGITAVDGILADLGVSSMQLDEAGRGFSFRRDEPLDMRMDPTRGESAAQWLARATQAEIREAIEEYGEERFAKQVAAAIVAARAREPIVRTQQLAELVAAAVRTREAGQSPATRTFQALRLLVNRELEEVSLMLPQAVARLAPGGRLAVVSFHSLEDRIVKRFLRALAKPDVPRDLPLRASEMPQPLLTILGRPQRPAAREIAANPRARSAVLRAAERTTAPLDPTLLSRIEPDAWRS